MQSDPLPSDSKLKQIDWSRRTEPAELPEWMDEPCTYEQLRSCLRDLGRVNTLTLGYRPTLSFLARLIARRNSTQKLRILDVGFGGGDTLHRIAGWSQAHGVPVQLTGIDLNPLAKRVAEEKYADTNAGTDITWLVGDALAYRGEADVVISSLLTHHLATEHVVRFVRWMEKTATVGWFINDLERSARSASLFGLLSRAMRWHPFVRHDGPVSFARTFVLEDWVRILSEAGLPSGAAEVYQHFPARLCVSRFQ